MAYRRAVSFAAIVVGVVATDQASKALVRASMAVSETTPLIDGVVWLTHIENTGAAFGILRGQQWLLIATAVVMLAAVMYVMVRLRPVDRWTRVALALVAGGAIGNLIDRVASGAVTDFIDLGWFPVFNIADIALDIGVAILVVVMLFRSEHAPAGHRESPASQPTDGSQDAEVCAADA